MRNNVSSKLCLISVLALGLAAGCGREAEEAVLKIYHAGSLSVPFQKLEAAFEAAHPGVDVRREAYGSAMAIRQVTELGKSADLVASADYRLIDRMMIDGSPRWAEWNLLFARNAMCIAYGPHSPPIRSDNWASVLMRDEVRIGISNPNHDPCGYRSLMTLYLGQTQIGNSGLFDRIVLENSNISLAVGDTGAVIKVPEAVEFSAPLVVRPKEMDLVALLQAGAIDYLFIYRSVAVQHGWEFLPLPDEINLGSPVMDSAYGNVTVLLFADKPENTVEVKCSSIVYGVTIPSTVRRSELAAEFIRLLISEEGSRILEDCGQAPVRPSTYSSISSLPERPF